jgi:YHS domain-containing protein
LLFRAAGLVPTARPTTIAPAHFSWNYTTYLNLIFLALFGILYWVYRNRERLGAGDRFARDPVCGMQIEKAHAPAWRGQDGERQYFCSDHCAERFDADGRNVERLEHDRVEQQSVQQRGTHSHGADAHH